MLCEQAFLWDVGNSLRGFFFPHQLPTSGNDVCMRDIHLAMFHFSSKHKLLQSVLLLFALFFKDPVQKIVSVISGL